jgi:hypothetical protein
MHAIKHKRHERFSSMKDERFSTTKDAPACIEEKLNTTIRQIVPNFSDVVEKTTLHKIGLQIIQMEEAAWKVQR